MASDLSKIMIVSGEASGDLHGSNLAAEFKKINPSLILFGMGGTKMREQGVNTVVDSEVSASVMGISEVISKLGSIYKAYKLLIETAKKEKPAVAVLIDYAEFNMLLAKQLKKLGIKVVYYIPPQIWAWRQGRVKKIKKYFDLVISIFPFEEAFYLKNGVTKVKFLGHPFANTTTKNVNHDELNLVEDNSSITNLILSSNTDIKLEVLNRSIKVAILPGSRKHEILNLLPAMLEAVKIILIARPTLYVLIPVAPTIDQQLIKKILIDSKIDLSKIVIVNGHAEEVLQFSDFGLVASGTATLQACLALCPSIVCYQVSNLTYQIGKKLVKGVRFISIVNIIANKEIFPELLQDNVNGVNIAKYIESIMFDQRKISKIKGELGKVKDKLSYTSGDQKTSPQRAAEEILKLIYG